MVLTKDLGAYIEVQRHTNIASLSLDHTERMENCLQKGTYKSQMETNGAPLDSVRFVPVVDAMRPYMRSQCLGCARARDLLFQRKAK